MIPCTKYDVATHRIGNCVGSVGFRELLNSPRPFLKNFGVVFLPINFWNWDFYMFVKGISKVSALYRTISKNSVVYF